MKNKIILLGLLALILILSLAGCSSSGNGASGSGDTTSDLPIGTEPSSNTEVNSTQKFLDSITPETAEAKGVCGADLTWYYQDGVLVIKGTGEMTDYDSLSRNAPWNEFKDKIGWIIVEEGITSIGSWSLNRMSALSKISLPESLRVINDGGLSDCNNLSNIELPQGLEVMGAYSVSSDSMDSITIPSSVKEMGSNAVDCKKIIFEGDAPEMPVFGYGNVDNPDGFYLMNIGEADITIIYSGNGFDEYIEQCPQYNWVKQ